MDYIVAIDANGQAQASLMAPSGAAGIPTAFIIGALPPGTLTLERLLASFQGLCNRGH
jgi:hypothetical protein